MYDVRLRGGIVIRCATATDAVRLIAEATKARLPVATTKPRVNSRAETHSKRVEDLLRAIRRADDGISGEDLAKRLKAKGPKSLGQIFAFLRREIEGRGWRFEDVLKQERDGTRRIWRSGSLFDDFYQWFAQYPRELGFSEPIPDEPT